MTTGTEPSELERLKKELDHEHDMHLRSLADFDNYRRRVERDREASTRRGKRDLLLSMIDLLDGFERALPHMSGAPAPALEGIMAIHRQLLNSLEAQGVTPFETVGQRFDPELHEAVGSEQSDQHESGTVTEEVRRGYRWGDELLRPARVRVAQ
jgi:molecular chaperone GrpE